MNMEKKKSKLQMAKDEAQFAINKINEKIDELGNNSNNLCSELIEIQEIFDVIRNIPSEKKLQYKKLKNIRLDWKQKAEKIEKDYNNAQIKNVGKGAAGTSLGVAVVTMAPTAAMGIATTFGVASTGTAISTLSGAAATNAALAWLGGGALAVGGGGMAAGNAFLALAGPVGWAIAGVALLTTGFFMWKNHKDKKHIEEVFTLISKRDVRSYKLAIIELNERIDRIKDESRKLNQAIENVKTFGVDYDAMTEEQQYSLGAYVNLMLSSTQLLVNPILGLQPKYTETDFGEFVSKETNVEKANYYTKYKNLIISLANFLFKIDLNDRDKKLLWKYLKRNKEMLKSMGVTKKDFSEDIINSVMTALSHKYTLSD